MCSSTLVPCTGLTEEWLTLLRLIFSSPRKLGEDLSVMGDLQIVRCAKCDIRIVGFYLTESLRYLMGEYLI